ncbi:hypothetical protein DC083_01600 [Ignatzschineria ureiclastica]|uniref:TonB-dependent receptor n=1 Tax=Ignatzschineria ureiclastica TaxID=472582 RepID=A0A2U2AGX8_9GAMM|nr:TonB-dependent receptor [Ignatzschineria ureiclastica]PWD81901.1 hypothetical protein DC083_01600 [Ignatzschineria ureiclastica]GGZ91315.1 TonB-dependent receptor [Ignatzschineria ureiclastica]
MKFPQKRTALALFAILSSTAFAQNVAITEKSDEIVFTANKTPTLLSEVGSQTIVINQQEIENRQYHSATEALAAQPGIILSQTSTVGPSSIFVRGAASQHTLVLVDGVPLGDPMGTGRTVDFSLLGSLLDVNRIEVLKGPQSSIYGSSAMGGVIQIFTNDLNKPGTKFRVMAGSHETIQTSATTTGAVGDLRYSLSGLFENTRGIDATTTVPKPESKYDKDRNKNRQLSGRFNYLLNENFDVDLAFTYNNRYSEYDNLFNTTPYNDYIKSKLFTGRVALNGSFFEDQWNSTLSYALMNLHRDDYSGADVYDANWMPVGVEESHYRYRGKSQTVNFDNELTFYKDFATRFGLAYQKEEGSGSDRIKHSQNTKSIYLEQSLNFADKFFNTVGIRYDKNSVFGSKTTYRLTSRYNFNDMVAIKGSFGTGFTTPSIYQYYMNGDLNKDLKAETSRGFDLGIEVKPTTDSLIGLSYFYTTYKNMIDYYGYPGAYQAPWGEYRNLDRAKIKGFEVVGSVEINDQWGLSGSYTYLDAKQKKDGGEYEKMLRRPKHQVTASVTYKPIESVTLNASGTYYGKRQDINNKELSSFAVFDIAGSYKINRRFSVDAKIQNLFDKDYEFAKGYRENGRTAYVGMNIDL